MEKNKTEKENSASSLVELIDSRASKATDAAMNKAVKTRNGVVVSYDDSTHCAVVRFPEEGDKVNYSFYNKTPELLEDGDTVKVFYTNNLAKGWIGARNGEPSVKTIDCGVGRPSPWDETSEYFNCYDKNKSTGRPENVAGTYDEKKYYATAKGYHTKAEAKYSNAGGYYSSINTTSTYSFTHGMGNSISNSEGASSLGKATTIFNSEDSQALGGYLTLQNSSNTLCSGARNMVTNSESSFVQGTQGVLSNSPYSCAMGNSPSINNSSTFKGLNNNTGGNLLAGSYSSATNCCGTVILGVHNTAEQCAESMIIGSYNSIQKAQMSKDADITYGNMVSGNQSHVKGSNCALSLGYRCTLDNSDYSALIGNDLAINYSTSTFVNGHSHRINGCESSFVEGYYNSVDGTYDEDKKSYSVRYCHIEGANHDNIKSGECLHVEGNSNSISGKCNHVGGRYSDVSGECDFVYGEGCQTSSTGKNRFVIGTYNNTKDIDGYLFVIGNGSSNWTRSNAFAVDKNGYIHCRGIKSTDNNDDIFTEYSETEAITSAKTIFAKVMG